MSNVKVLLNGQQVPVSNINEFEVGLTFNPIESPNALPINRNTLTFPAVAGQLDGVDIINNWIANNDILTGLPVSIQDNTLGELLPTGYLDFASEDNVFDDEKCEYTIEVRTWFQDFADRAGFDLRPMWQNMIFPDDCFRVGYVKETGIEDSYEDNKELVGLQVVFLIMTVQIAEQGSVVAEVGGKAVNAILYGTGSAGATADLVLETVKEATILAAYIAAYIDLLKQISDNLFDKPRFLRAVPVSFLLEKGAEKLGFKFESSLLEGEFQRLSLIARIQDAGTKSMEGNNNPIPSITYIDLLNAIGNVFGAKAKLEFNPTGTEGTIRFERQTYYTQRPVRYNLPLLERPGTFRYNVGELNKTVAVEFATDDSEQNSLFQSRTRFGANYELTRKIDSSRELLKGEQDIQIPFARGRRKSQQKSLERFFNTLYDLIAQLRRPLSFFGIGTSEPTGQLGDRIGFMIIQTDKFGVDKLVLPSGSNGRLDSNSETLISPEYIFRNFHSNKDPRNAQQLIYDNPSDYVECRRGFIYDLQQNNVIDNRGKITILEKVQFNLDTSQLSIEQYRVQEKFLPDDLIKEETFSV